MFFFILFYFPLYYTVLSFLFSLILHCCTLYNNVSFEMIHVKQDFTHIKSLYQQCMMFRICVCACGQRAAVLHFVHIFAYYKKYGLSFLVAVWDFLSFRHNVIQSLSSNKMQSHCGSNVYTRDPHSQSQSLVFTISLSLYSFRCIQKMNRQSYLANWLLYDLYSSHWVGDWIELTSNFSKE